MRPWLQMIVALGGLLLSCPACWAQAAEVAKRDLLRVATDDDRPWLVLNTSGHTAPIQALAFSPDGRRLFSAGQDKALRVWNMQVASRDLVRRPLLERSFHWQISRGPRGAIYALAVANDGLVALGGYGASGGLGEILLIDSSTGTLRKTLQGHAQSIASLAFSADGQSLASADLSGRALLWNRDGAPPVEVSANDIKRYGEALARSIAIQARFRPLAYAPTAPAPTIVWPVCASTEPEQPLRWRLSSITPDGKLQDTPWDQDHWGCVTALAAQSQGKHLASADLTGKAYLWTLEPQPRAEPLDVPGIVTALAFSPDGRQLVVGTARSAKQKQSWLQVWDVTTRQLLWQRSLADHVLACSMSADGKRLAYSGGAHHALHISDLRADATPSVLSSAARPVTKVAFAAREPRYRFAWGHTRTEVAFNDYGQLAHSFDPVGLALDEGELDVDDWLGVNWSQGPWRAAIEPSGMLQLYEQDQPRGTITLDPQWEGRAVSLCWLTDPQGQPNGLVVGTDVQNSLYVFHLAQRGECPLRRHFRGHQDLVSSVGVSRDMKYLVSGGGDGTVRLWSLADWTLGNTLLGRWGAELKSEAAGLRVTRVAPGGPLYFRGVREGDILKQLDWPGKDAPQSSTDADVMLRRLGAAAWDEQLVFHTLRGKLVLRPFQSLSAWQPLATLLATQEREWAYWTPEGYYDASVNGRALFGWQVNRGLDRLADFYRADQFRRLERPDVLEHLLLTGSVSAALAARQQAATIAPDQLVPTQIAATPRVEILTPSTTDRVAQDTLQVRARVRLAKDVALSNTQVFANGVAASQERLVERRELDDAIESTYEWNARLPSEHEHLIQVWATSAVDTIGQNSVVVAQEGERPLPRRSPKLYVLAVGIDHYRDEAVQPLAYGVADARSVVSLFESSTQGLYSLGDKRLLLNERVTPQTWRETFAALHKQLRTDAQPDDLLVIFLAGHGFVDSQTQRYYFAGQAITRDEYQRGDYRSSIACDDFHLLADIPCRKLALLDTCHSGAIVPLRDRQLKSVVRALQQDVILTLTASAGHEKSEERAEWQHGAFTKVLLAGLQGQADRSQDGVVSLDEIVSYVQREVPQLTSGRQNPTAGPAELLPFVQLPLTRDRP